MKDFCFDCGQQYDEIFLHYFTGIDKDICLNCILLIAQNIGKELVKKGVNNV